MYLGIESCNIIYSIKFIDTIVGFILIMNLLFYNENKFYFICSIYKNKPKI